MSKVDTAVILAAGLGSRLGSLKEEKPKAFLSINGETLIDRSIRLLKEKNIKSIIIGTGYRHEYFDELAQSQEGIMTRKNEQYDNTGSMYTLYVLRDLITKPFLLLEGDLLYEPLALDLVLDDERQDVVLASDATHSGDEVYIQCDAEGRLENMSKDVRQLKSKSGELVGISKLSKEALSAMVTFSEKKYSEEKFGIHYEDALVGISATRNVFVKVAEGLAWCEIDDESHLDRALNVVYPRIVKRN